MTDIRQLTAQQRRTMLAEALRQRSARSTLEFPASYGQKAMYLLQEREPQSAAYNVLLSGEIRGAIDADCLQRAFEYLVERHAVLRTTYATRNGEVVQNVHSHMAPVFEVKAGDADSASLFQRINAAAQVPFDLSSGPMVRVGLWTSAPNQHVLTVVTHHIAVDFWSLVVLLDEVSEVYSALKQKRAPHLPDLCHSVAEFAQTERTHVEGPESEPLWKHWLDKMEGELPVLDFPTDYPRRSTQGFAGDTLDLAIEAELAARLRQVAQSHGVTPFALFASAFTALLHRYTSQRVLLVALPMLTRPSADWESVIGYLTNPVALRCEIDPALPFTELMSRTSEAALEASEFQSLPFPALVQRLGINDPSRPALCQAGFSWDRPHHDRRDWSLQGADTAAASDGLGLTVLGVKARQMGAPYELSMVVFEDGEQLVCATQFNTGLFKPATIERFNSHFRNLLESVAENPSWAVADLPLIGEAERSSLLGPWGRNERPYPSEMTVEAIFERQVERAPRALAVQYGESRLNYEELNQRANQLASALIRNGVKRGSLVGVCLDRSCDLIASLLGILKAGATYLPLDPDYPTSRLQFMLQDTEAVLVITTSELRNRLPGQQLFLSLDEAGSIDSEDCANPGLNGDASDVAYVMYTSGSTGLPKGICIPHRGITRLVLNTDYVKLGPGDRILQASNACFDASTFEIWGALLNGGAVIGFAKETMLAAPSLAHELRANGITTMFVTTALFNQLVREAPGVFASLREVLFGGEACDPGAVRAVLSDHPPARLIHVYGPTETTTFATWHEVRSEELNESDTNVPIGLPIANTEAYVLDESLRLLPVGVAGELFLGGDGVALGYLHRDVLTAERFVPNPFTEGSGKSLYRTGDLVRRRADGSLEFLGRNDDQVKIRGFRIEPGEIESALRSHPDVAEAVVMVRQDDSGARKLVAYAVPSEGSKVEPHQLREFLQSRLAYYMMPAAIMMMASIPLTPNGKIDRTALPVPQPSDTVITASAEPRNENERALAEIWQQTLNLPKVGINDNFFELGGDSISVVRVASRAAAAGIDITPLQVFQHQTIAELARAIVAPREPLVHPDPQQSTNVAAEFEWSSADMSAINSALRDIQTRK